jgi:hypothetical protein
LGLGLLPNSWPKPTTTPHTIAHTATSAPRGDLKRGDTNGYQEDVKTVEGVEEVYEDLGHQDSAQARHSLSFSLIGGTADVFGLGGS